MTPDLRRLEAVLFASGHPLDEGRLGEVLGWSRIELQGHLEDYAREIQGRAFRLEREDAGWVLLTRPEHASDVARALEGRSRELSSAALETLAAVAYFEPVERSFVDRLRGVRSERSLLVLEEEELIEAAGRGSGPGRPVLWRTTPEFRRRFGFEGLPELPVELVAEAEALRTRPAVRDDGEESPKAEEAKDETEGASTRSSS